MLVFGSIIPIEEITIEQNLIIEGTLMFENKTIKSRSVLDIEIVSISKDISIISNNKMKTHQPILGLMSLQINPK